MPCRTAQGCPCEGEKGMACQPEVCLSDSEVSEAVRVAVRNFESHPAVKLVPWCRSRDILKRCRVSCLGKHAADTRGAYGLQEERKE